MPFDHAIMSEIFGFFGLSGLADGFLCYRIGSGHNGGNPMQLNKISDNAKDLPQTSGREGCS